MAGTRPGLTSSQKGTISEYVVATALMMESAGRLSPFVPLSDDHGVDLVVLDKETGRSVAVQVKSRMGTASSSRGTVQFDVHKSTYWAKDGAMLLAIVLRPSPIAIEASWLIPMSEVPRLGADRPKKYALRPNRSPKSRDEYSEFRHADVASLVTGLIGVLAGREPNRGEGGGGEP